MADSYTPNQRADAPASRVPNRAPPEPAARIDETADYRGGNRHVRWRSAPALAYAPATIALAGPSPAPLRSGSPHTGGTSDQSAASHTLRACRTLLGRPRD